MSTRELDRLQVLGRVADKRLTQREAASVLGVTERQLRRLWKRYQADGAVGLVSKRRGRPSNRRLREVAIAVPPQNPIRRRMSPGYPLLIGTLRPHIEPGRDNRWTLDPAL